MKGGENTRRFEMTREFHLQLTTKNTLICIGIMKESRSRRQLMLPLFVTVLLLNCGVMEMSAQGGTEVVRSNYPKEHVCSSIDVRNTVKSFKKLENCTVIEGFLTILLIENADPADYANLTFPKLREITDYLLLYRAFGLKSLRNLFPNLMVIRGFRLFHNYALVIFQMMDLQEIGLPRLTHILRGGVRIEKNPKLCYVDTIDWDLLSKDGETHFIKENSPDNNCPNVCPNRDANGRQCPLSREGAKKDSWLCWSGYDCQKICSSNCDKRACGDDLGSCCHPECLGGCNGTSQADCFVCKNVLFQGKCTRSCPENTFEYMNRRCLTDGECIALSYYDVTEERNITYKPFFGLCSTGCPSNYTQDRINASRCVPCEGLCPKECSGMQITSVQEAQKLNNCTKIKGNLDIQITGGQNVVKELEKHLSMIKEITGSLKVIRSVPLVSLSFLKNLQRISSDKDSGPYALYVLDNPNLEYLWNWDERGGVGLTVDRGKIFFHYNPKLCLEEISKLENISNIEKSSEKDVSPQSNGNRKSCKMTVLELNAVKIDSNMVMMRWTNFFKSITDYRSLLGYLLSYKEAPHGIVDLFDDHDACSTDSWKVVDVAAEESDLKSQYVVDVISNLKPYTRYAVYVKTFTVATEKNGGQSPIIYFTTNPTKPTSPVNVKVYTYAPTRLEVAWNPPENPNGQITHYIVKGKRRDDSQEFFDIRNYCTEPLTKVDTKPTKDPIDNGSAITPGSDLTPDMKPGACCPCTGAGSPTERKKDEAERQFQIQFENFLHDRVYIKRKVNSSEEMEFPVTVVEPTMANRVQRMAVIAENDFENRIRRETYGNVNMDTADFNGGIRVLRDRKSQPNALPNLNSPVVTTTKTVKPEVVIDQLNNTNGSAVENLKMREFMTNDSFQKNVTSLDSLKVSIENLKHFSEYIIEVIACQEGSSVDFYKACSGEAIVTARTQHAELVDDIDSKSVTTAIQNKTSNAVLIRWKIPPNPNGLILSFSIEIKSSESDVSDYSHPQCITHKDYLAANGYTAQGLASGNYSLRVRATSLAGPGEWTTPTYFSIPESSSTLSIGLIVGIVVITILIVATVFGGATFYIKKRASRVPEIMYASVNPEYLSNMYVADEWEIPREKITILKELGQGSFGMVYEGKAKDIDADLPFVRCAVKTVNESASLRERIEFLNEASVMKSFRCNHVVKLLGVVSKGQPTLVVMELMANGDLKSYLRSHRPDAEENAGRQPPTLKRLLQMAIEIADGMSYLAFKKYVHRDLAARNCMVSETLTVKIGDFGMTRDIYETDYYRKGGKGLLPVRWMAPESLKDGVFTSQSDVWSYGIVLWEMATLASQPYQGLSNEQVLKYVIDGGIMEKPENCPERLFELMRACFHYNPKFRPNFMQLIENLLPDSNSNFSQFSFYHNGHNGERDSGGDQLNDQDQDLDGDGEDKALPSTPLRSPQDETTKDDSHVLDEENDASQNNKTSAYPKLFRFPHRSQSKHHHHHHHRPHSRHQPPLIPIPQSTVGGPTFESGSKGVSTNSSDGSKASACSANGSLLNGHIGVPLSINRTAEC